MLLNKSGMFFYQNSYVKSAGRKGRGVFARRNLKKGVVIESSPFIILPPKDYQRTSDSVLNEYRYEVKGRTCAIGLGHTSLYNHSEDSNAEFHVRARSKSITIKATRNIKKDEEITISYGWKPEF